MNSMVGVQRRQKERVFRSTASTEFENDITHSRFGQLSAPRVWPSSWIASFAILSRVFPRSGLSRWAIDITAGPL